MLPLYQRSNRSATLGPVSTFRRRTRNCELIAIQSVIAAIALVTAATAMAEDPAIDRLLKKLPPPEKLVQSGDPVVSDPLTNKTVQAINARNFGQGLDLARQLTHVHPASAVAHGLHGWMAFMLHQYSEAATEFRKSIKLQSNYSFGYFGLGYAEAAQNHYTSALQNFQQLARLEPRTELAWIGSSQCAERLGRHRDSVGYARRATELAPRSALAWLQLARAEDLVGDKAASQRAFSRARELGAKSSGSSRSRG